MTDHHKLRSLRRFIVTDDPRFPGKKKLKIKGKDLVQVAREVFFITELEVLDLSPEREACLEYQMEECPEEIGKLINLQVLMLDTNELWEVPTTIVRLVKLEKLSLSNNCIHVLPSRFSNLINLTSLHMSNNKFMEFPKDICALSNLGFLDISDNDIARLPSDIAKLQNMHSFIIFNNKLEQLPDSITDLRNLRCLWLGSNRLTSLPRKFGSLALTDWGTFGRHMFSTILDGNPLTQPPLDICKQGIKAIAQYFGASPSYDRTRGAPEDPHSYMRNGVGGKATHVHERESNNSSHNLSSATESEPNTARFVSNSSLSVPKTVYGGNAFSPRSQGEGKGHTAFSKPGYKTDSREGLNNTRTPYSQDATPRNRYK